MEYYLEVDVHAHWNTKPPAYRLYVNDELFTERTFGWIAHQYYLTEHISCILDSGSHILRLENLNPASNFELENFKVNEETVSKRLVEKFDNIITWKFNCEH